jgi:hypothetical protein
MHCVSHVSAATVNAQVRFQHEKHAVNEGGWCSAWHAPTRLCVRQKRCATLVGILVKDEFLGKSRQIVRNFFQLAQKHRVCKFRVSEVAVTAFRVGGTAWWPTAHTSVRVSHVHQLTRAAHCATHALIVDEPTMEGE